MKSLCSLLVVFASVVSGVQAEPPTLQLTRLPEGSLQPRAVPIATSGGADVIFLQGRPEACDVKLGQLTAAGGWAEPGFVTLNTSSTQAVGGGTVRGPSIARSQSGVRHVVWHGKNGTATSGKGSALYYTQVDVDGKVAAPRDMMGTTTALDGGAAVVAGSPGKVWLVWHALPAGADGELGRRLFIRSSTDDGRTFSEPWPVAGEDVGICACCGLAATLGGDGSLYILYRTAEQRRGRGIRVLKLPAGADGQTRPEVLGRDLWELEGCPMTTADLQPSADGAVPVWVNRFRLASSLPFVAGVTGVGASGTPALNHPRLVQNSRGESLLVWTDGAAWGKGGKLRAQQVSASGSPIGEPWSHPLPVWSYGAGVALADGRFVILY